MYIEIYTTLSPKKYNKEQRRIGGGWGGRGVWGCLRIRYVVGGGGDFVRNNKVHKRPNIVI